VRLLDRSMSTAEQRSLTFPYPKAVLAVVRGVLATKLAWFIGNHLVADPDDRSATSNFVWPLIASLA
jgi:hypothetical protein